MKIVVDITKRTTFAPHINPAHRYVLDKSRTRFMHYVYIIQSKLNKQFYIGCTSDMNNRLSEHNEGKVRSTAPYIPYEIIYFEGYRDKTDAFKREKMLKHHGQGFRRLKERLMNSILSGT